MAVFNEPAQWDHTLGNNADTSTLPDDAAATAGIASLQKLFQLINATPLEAGGIAPDREDVNALFKYLGDQIFYTQNGGIPSYNAAYDYIPGRVVLYDNNLYKCIQVNGVSSTVVAPGSDTAYWRQLDNIDPIPCGSYIQHAGDNAPSGFLVCNGSAISRTTYAKLFSVIGTKYGDGDGSTTFNLPNLIGRFLEGGIASGTVFEAGLPNITGSLAGVEGSPGKAYDWGFRPNTSSDNAINVIQNMSLYNTYGAGGYNVLSGREAGFNASRSSPIYGKSSTVQPNAVTCLICIKY